MTALAGRRRRATLVGAGLAAGAIVVAGGLGFAGAVALYNSTDGARVDAGRPELVFPATPTALLAGVDDEGGLASLTVLVVQPDGSGGSIVAVPVSADATAGEGDERLPLAETVELAGTDVLRREAEVLLSLTFDTVEIADADRLAELLEPVGSVEVELADDVTDRDGDTVVRDGTATLDPAEAAAVLTSRDPDVAAADQYPAAVAVWEGVATAVGDGLPGGGDAAVAGESGIVDLLGALFGGSVRHRSLAADAVDDERNPRGVDVCLLDRVELALVFGQIAPARMSAPNPALAFRVVSAYPDAALAELGMTNADVAYQAIAQLLFLRSNVLSVDTTAGEVPAATVIELADESMLDPAEVPEDLFGDLDIRVAESRIAGIDAVLYLGEAYLDFLESVEQERAARGDAPVAQPRDDTADSATIGAGTTDSDTNGEQ